LTTEQQEQGKGIPGYPAPKPEDLPEDELENQPGFMEAHSKEDKSIIYGDIPQQSQPTTPVSGDPDDYFSDIGSRVYRYFAQYDTHDIEMCDGTTVKYTGMFPSALDYEELEDLRIQIIARTSLDYQTDNEGNIISGKRYSIIDIRNMEKRWLDDLAKTYLFNTKTKKPMTPEERKSCKYQWVIYGILKSKLKRSANDNGPVGKN